MSSDSIITLSADNFEIVALSNDTSGLETGQNLVSILNATEGERLKTRLTSLEALPTTCFQLTLKDKLRTLSAMKQDAHYCLTLHHLSDDPIAESLSEMERFDEIEDALRKSNTQLNDFVYTIAHQLKEPLRQVASYAELNNEDRPPFVAVIFKRSQEKFRAQDMDPTTAFQGRIVRVKGMMQSWRMPEIIVSSPDQIEIVR